MKEVAKTLWKRIEAGMNAYNDSVRAMSNQELWEFCFDSGEDSMPEDFCRQEWERRETYCLCPSSITTGWIEIDGKCCCNICGKEQEGEILTNTI